MSNKTSDKNVANIEEDIKILENLKSYLNLLVYEGKDKIIYNDLLWDEKTVDCINAIEHLINNYTRQKQINEEHQKINGELRERIKELEEANKIFALEGSKVRLELYIKENYIPIQVVKDKIKEIKRLRDKCITTEGYNIANGEVVVLQELLQEEDK